MNKKQMIVLWGAVSVIFIGWLIYSVSCVSLFNSIFNAAANPNSATLTEMKPPLSIGMILYGLTFPVLLIAGLLIYSLRDKKQK